ncbi:MAG: helix-turn-helix transcriptional regulator [Oscillospiraceae bacterium]|nr:helix-turn-helix transcriptional regulator [Oscillospiraceae bacterium]
MEVNEMKVNERIKKVRQTLKLTQVKFAERIAISPTYLSDMEFSGKPVSDRVIRLVSLEYSVSEHWIRTGEGDMFNEAEELDVIKAKSLFKSLNPSFRACALEQLNLLSNLNIKTRAEKY